jgi:hypothetical protein
MNNLLLLFESINNNFLKNCWELDENIRLCVRWMNTLKLIKMRRNHINL